MPQSPEAIVDELFDIELASRGSKGKPHSQRLYSFTRHSLQPQERLPDRS
jgi:hypothetical protein